MDTVTTTPNPVGQPVPVVLVGTERVTRAGLRMLIDSQPGLHVIGEVERIGDPPVVWNAEQPQIALVDLDGPGSLGSIRDLRPADISNTRIIVLTSTPDSEACASAIRHGVLGVVSKQQAPAVLIKAIERVHAGEAWLNRAKIAGVVGSLRASAAASGDPTIGRPDALLPRERQIIALVGRGFHNSEIAATIFVSEATVRKALGSIFKKLGISNRVRLMVYAIQEGFVNLSVSVGPRAAGSPRDTVRLATVGGRPLGERRRP